jgi:cytochrome c oxidase cbb3-type subunit 3
MSTKDKVLDHSYDGIQEYDNRLPNWWLYTLYGAIVFGFGYWIFVHTLGVGDVPTESYDKSMIAAAEAQLERMAGQELTDESLALMAGVPTRVSAGQKVFGQFCVACHLESGAGSVGPNLTDAYWLHGNRPLEIHDTINNGVLDKGMAAWGNQLGPQRVNDVVAYVLTLKDTNVEGKEPQGVIPVEGGSDAAAEPAAPAAGEAGE